MAEETTVAQAIGNADGLLHVVEGYEPEALAFPSDLTEEEERLHFYFNDEILEVAEEYQKVLDEWDRAQGEVEKWNARQAAIFAEAREYGGNSEFRPIELNANVVAGYERSLADCEDRILRIMEGVRSQYYDRAINLTERREEIVSYAAVVRAEEQRIALEDSATTEEERLEHFRGFDPDIQAAHYEFNELDSIFVEYKLLRNGISINPSRIDWAGLVWFGVGLVVAEIVTAGIISIVGVIAAGARTIPVVARLSGRMAVAGERLRRRYNALLDSGKDLLARARLRSRGRPVPEGSNTGPQALLRHRAAKSRLCSAGACRL